jgi:hypothetical protein
MRSVTKPIDQVWFVNTRRKAFVFEHCKRGMRVYERSLLTYTPEQQTSGLRAEMTLQDLESKHGTALELGRV